jgi:hypothetical protein
MLCDMCVCVFGGGLPKMNEGLKAHMTYNGRPCEMLSEEHILLLFCIRHIA